MAKIKNKGQFQPGQSGNPEGRPKGSKNEITLLKESMELLLRQEASPEDLRKVMRQALDLAIEGDRSMIKLILELHMSKGVTDIGGKATDKVEITINGPTEVTSKKEEQAPVQGIGLTSGVTPVFN